MRDDLLDLPFAPFDYQMSVLRQDRTCQDAVACFLDGDIESAADRASLEASEMDIEILYALAWPSFAARGRAAERPADCRVETVVADPKRRSSQFQTYHPTMSREDRWEAKSRRP